MSVAPVCRFRSFYPTITRESLSWKSLGNGFEEISIDLANDGEEATLPGALVVEAAPLGAFVPFLPVTRVAVGALDPGERETVKVDVHRALLDAITNPMLMPLESIRSRADVGGWIRPSTRTHFLGNLNVYFEREPENAVERHCAFGLRVPASCTLMASLLTIGDLDCTFEVRVSSPNWKAQMEVVGHVGSLFAGSLLVHTPPEPGEQARVTVEVTSPLAGKTVPVEFEFETVKGWGESVGCVRV